MKQHFETAQRVKGIRCSMDHKNLPPTATAFSGTILDHMKEWHPKIYADVVAMNEANRDKKAA